MTINSVTIKKSTLSLLLSRLQEFLKIISELTKFRITFFVSVTTYVGFILFSKTFDGAFVMPTLGVLLLACGASALNEYQERILDSQMKRTLNRPIPSGRISGNGALKVSIIFMLTGAIFLSLSNINALLIGLFTLVWYNGIYTPLKKISSFAIIPGALVGALPPIIGWVAAGGELFDVKILSFATFMFIWQIPHFWLLLLMYDDEYREAGFPTLSKVFNHDQIVKITFGWIVVFFVSTSLFLFSDLMKDIMVLLFVLGTGTYTLVKSINILSQKNRTIFRKTFMLINLYVLVVLIAIVIETQI